MVIGLLRLFPAFRRLELEVAVLRERLDAEVRRNADQARLLAYWQTRGERFVDDVGAHAGILRRPVMREAEPPRGWLDQTPLAGLGITEINRPGEAPAS